MTTYRERWQYQPWVSTHKSPDSVKMCKEKNGKEKWIPFDSDENDLSTITIQRRSSDISTFAVGLKDFSFVELVDASRNGHTLRRLGAKETRFLIIDIDDVEARLEPHELDLLVSDKFQWTKSSSGKDYKYHLFIFLDCPISCQPEAESQSNLVKEKIKARTGKSVKLDVHQYSLDQACFGPCQDRMVRRELPNTVLWTFLLSRRNNFEIFRVDPNVLFIMPKPRIRMLNGKRKPRLMPWDTPMLANKLNDGSLRAKKNEDGSYVNKRVFLQGKRFDISLARFKKGKDGFLHQIKIPAGKRYTTASALLLKIVPQYFRCQQLGLFCYTQEDIEYTIQYLCTSFFEDGPGWWNDEGEKVIKSLRKELVSNENLTFPEIFDKYKSSHSGYIYRRRGYGYDVSARLIEQYLSEDGTHIVIESRDVLKSLLAEQLLSYSTFLGYVQKLGYSILYCNDGRSTNVYDYILDEAQPDNVYFYDMLVNAEKCFCKRHHISYINCFKSSARDIPQSILKRVRAEACKAFNSSMLWFESLTYESLCTKSETNAVGSFSDDGEDLPFDDQEIPCGWKKTGSAFSCGANSSKS